MAWVGGGPVGGWGIGGVCGGTPVAEKLQEWGPEFNTSLGGRELWAYRTIPVHACPYARFSLINETWAQLDSC